MWPVIKKIKKSYISFEIRGSQFCYYLLETLETTRGLQKKSTDIGEGYHN